VDLDLQVQAGSRLCIPCVHRLEGTEALHKTCHKVRAKIDYVFSFFGTTKFSNFSRLKPSNRMKKTHTSVRLR
jgi:hypothetical protein